MLCRHLRKGGLCSFNRPDYAVSLHGTSVVKNNYFMMRVRRGKDVIKKPNIAYFCKWNKSSFLFHLNQKLNYLSNFFETMYAARLTMSSSQQEAN